MEILRIFVSSIADDLPLERDAIARGIISLRIESMRIEIDFSTGKESREEFLHRLHGSGIFLGVYERTRYSPLLPNDNISAAEFAFNQAQEAKKPTLVFVKNAKEVERASSRQSEFIGRVLELSAGKFGYFEYNSPDHLENLVASALQELLVTRFYRTVTRPPFQAPRMLDTFVERGEILDQVMTALAPGKIVVIHGYSDNGGLGKTQIAIRAAHQARATFSDGVLWANIPTARPEDVLVNWARLYGGLGVLGQGDLRFIFRPLSLEARQVTEITARIDAVQSVLRGKRVLAILDGVVDERDEEKVQTFLRALGDCAVLVTSRTTRLPSFDLITPIEVPPMTEDESWQLFDRLVAVKHPDENLQAHVKKIAKVVDFLPLPLELVAVQLREDATWTLDSLGLALETERNNLETTRRGYSTARGMQAALNTCYSRLTPEDQRFFQMLGAFAGVDFDADAAVFVTDTTRDTVNATLERLTQFAFVQKKRNYMRYTLHPVLRTFARGKLEDMGAHQRMAAYYCALAREKGKELQSIEAHSALEILDTEVSNIFAGHRWAQTRNDRTGWELCRDYVYGAMIYYFNLKAMWTDWITWSVVGIEAAQKLGDERSASSIAGGLGLVSYRRGELDQAIEFYKQALALMEKLGLQAGAAAIYMNLGNVQTEKRAWKDAIESHSKSLQIYERLGNLHGLGQARANLGMLYAKYGDRTKARANWLQALEIMDHVSADHEADIVRKWLKNLGSSDFR